MGTSQEGYDIKFVESPPGALICQICTRVARNAHQVTCCGKLFCKGCLKRVNKLICPNCKEIFASFPDARGVQEIQSLKVECEGRLYGCTWNDQLRFHRDHINTCDNVLVTCPNNCVKDNAPVKVLRKDLTTHVQNECPKRPYSCPRCHLAGDYITMTTDHDDSCPKVKVQCPNLLCKSSIYRCNLDTHCQYCKYERVTCKYSEMGCDEKLIRKDMEKHESDGQVHLQLAIETVQTQNKQIKLLLEDSRQQKEQMSLLSEEGLQMKASYKKYSKSQSSPSTGKIVARFSVLHSIQATVVTKCASIFEANIVTVTTTSLRLPVL